MIQEKEDAAAWLSTLHGEELMQEAAVPKKIVAEDFFLWRNCGVIQSNCRMKLSDMQNLKARLIKILIFR